MTFTGVTFGMMTPEAAALDRRALAGAAILYVPGLIWLATWLHVLKSMDLHSSISAALTTGLVPFILGDIIKAVLAALAFPAAHALLGHR